jgi:hypothetical protein
LTPVNKSARHGLTYYAGLLSAAQYHGAAHHRPQEFQIVVAKKWAFAGSAIVDQSTVD